MADFATINSKDTNYPQDPKPESTSANFVTPYKVQTGQTRGDLQIKGKITVVDSNNVVRLIMGYDPGRF